MVRRAWESRSFSKVVSLLALFVALGGQAFGGTTLHLNGEDHPPIKEIATQKQLDALLAAMLDSFKQNGGVLTSDMIDDGTLKSKDIKPNTINSSDIKPNSLNAGDIHHNSLTGSLIQQHSLTGQLLKPDSLTGDLLKDKTLGSNLLKDQTITESKIKPNTITSAAIDEQKVTGVEKCTGDLHGPFGDVCVTDLQPAATWDEAELACDAMGLRLPTITEGLRALSTFGAAQAIWTDEVYGAENTASGRVAMRRIEGDGITLDGHTNSDSVQYRCVIKSSSST